MDHGGGGAKHSPPPIHIRQKQPNRDRVKHVCSNSGLHGYNLFSLFSRTLFGVCTKPEKSEKTQIDSSTIDVNVEFVHSQYSCILTSQVSIQFLCPTKLLISVIFFCVLYFLFLHFFIKSWKHVN